jgi:hypothetical protein
MQKQLIIVASALGGLVVAFFVGTAVASHVGSGGGTHPTTPYGNGYHRFGNGSGPFGGFASGNAVVGDVTKVSGNTITVKSFRGGDQTITVNQSTTYSKRSFGTNGPTSSTASLSNVKSGSFIFANGTKSDGTFLAKSVTLMMRPRFGNRPGFGAPPGSGSSSGGI